MKKSISTISYETNDPKESHEITIRMNMEDLMNIAEVINKSIDLYFWDSEMISLINLYKKLESPFKNSKYWKYADDNEIKFEIGNTVQVKDNGKEGIIISANHKDNMYRVEFFDKSGTGIFMCQDLFHT